MTGSDRGSEQDVAEPDPGMPDPPEPQTPLGQASNIAALIGVAVVLLYVWGGTFVFVRLVGAGISWPAASEAVSQLPREYPVTVALSSIVLPLVLAVVLALFVALLLGKEHTAVGAMRDHPLALVTVSGVLGTAVAIGMGFAIPSDRASVCVDGQRAGSTGNFIADTGDRILLATTAHDKRIVSFNADEVWKVRYGLQGRLACRRANPAPVR